MEARTRLQKRRLVRLGYHILLRAEAELELLSERPRIAGHGIALAQACLDWIAEVHGGALRRRAEESGALPVGTASVYQLRLRVAWEDGRHAALVYESLLREEGKSSRRRMSEVWCLAEESLLGKREILRRWGNRDLRGALSFSPESAYPQGEGTVFYRNGAKGAAWQECFLSRDAEESL